MADETSHFSSEVPIMLSRVRKQSYDKHSLDWIKVVPLPNSHIYHKDIQYPKFSRRDKENGYFIQKAQHMNLRSLFIE